MQLADNFILKIGSKKRIQHFVNAMHSAKMETERRMRVDLDRKILGMRIERLM
jgi:hypothetical protein